MSLGKTLINVAPYMPWRVNYNLRSLLGIFPNFIIAGFPKCGTTSLYNYLIQHPDILSADNKEQWYFSTFPLKPNFTNLGINPEWSIWAWLRNRKSISVGSKPK